MAGTPAPSSLRALYDVELAQRGYHADPSQLAALEALEDLRTRLIARGAPAAGGLWSRLLRRSPPPAERGVYLKGPVGRGKTWLMDLFVRSLPFPQARRRHFYRFMEETHAALKRHAGSQNPLERVAADIAADTRVLCFDELFVTDIGDAMILGTLFEALLRRGVSLVATSNTAPDDLYRDGLQRARFLPAIELLKRNLRIVSVDGGADYRLLSLQRAGTWLTRDPMAETTLAGLFQSLMRGEAATARTLRIAGRDIAARGAGSEVAWFEFSALCEGPRSPADYIEIARSWPTVILSHVPLLTPLMDDAARRFVALVDELYDHDVKLAAAAAAPPQELYRGERLRPEFQRTTSRLIEMQTPQYLGREHRP